MHITKIKKLANLVAIQGLFLQINFYASVSIILFSNITIYGSYIQHRSPKNSYVKTYPLRVGISRWGLWEVIKAQGSLAPPAT